VDLRRFQPRPATGYLHHELSLQRTRRWSAVLGRSGSAKACTLGGSRPVGCDGGAATHFVVVGRRYSDKPEAASYEWDLRQMTAVEPLAGRFHFLGLRDDVDRLLNEFHVLAHAARQEPLGRVLLEAAAAERPSSPRMSADAGDFPAGRPGRRARSGRRAGSDGRCNCWSIARSYSTAASECRRTPASRIGVRRARAAARLVTHYRDVLGGGEQGDEGLIRVKD